MERVLIVALVRVLIQALIWLSRYLLAHSVGTVVVIRSFGNWSYAPPGGEPETVHATRVVPSVIICVHVHSVTSLRICAEFEKSGLLNALKIKANYIQRENIFETIRFLTFEMFCRNDFFPHPLLNLLSATLTSFSR